MSALLLLRTSPELLQSLKRTPIFRGIYGGLGLVFEGLERTFFSVNVRAARLQEFYEKFKQQQALGITTARQAFG